MITAPLRPEQINASCSQCLTSATVVLHEHVDGFALLSFSCVSAVNGQHVCTVSGRPVVEEDVPLGAWYFFGKESTQALDYCPVCNTPSVLGHDAQSIIDMQCMSHDGVLDMYYCSTTV